MKITTKKIIKSIRILVNGWLYGLLFIPVEFGCLGAKKRITTIRSTPKEEELAIADEDEADIDGADEDGGIINQGFDPDPLPKESNPQVQVPTKQEQPPNSSQAPLKGSSKPNQQPLPMENGGSSSTEPGQLNQNADNKSQNIASGGPKNNSHDGKVINETPNKDQDSPPNIITLATSTDQDLKSIPHKINELKGLIDQGIKINKKTDKKIAKFCRDNNSIGIRDRIKNWSEEKQVEHIQTILTLADLYIQDLKNVNNIEK